MKSVFLAVILLFSFGLPVLLRAQRQLPAQPSGQSGTPPADSTAAPGGMAIDSTRPPTANIVRIYPGRLWQQTRFADSVRTSIVGVPVWDLTDTLQGYTQSLGQIGKPVAQWIHGTSAQLIDEAGWRNPYFGRKDPFVLSPSEDIPYFDTKTPYVNIAYMQGALRLQAVSVTVSGNVSPNLNIAAGHIRRKAAGIHSLNIDSDNATDHRAVYTAVYYRTDNRRYHGFVTGVYNDLSEDLFGGEKRTLSTHDSAAFIPNSSVRMLGTSLNDRIVQSAHTSHAYCLFGRPDDTLRHRQRLTLLADAGAEAMRWRYRVRSVNFDKLDENAVPVLPAIQDSSDLNWGITSSRGYVSAGAGYVLDAGVFVLGAKVSFGYDRQQFYEDNGVGQTDTLSQQTGWQNAAATLDIPALHTHLYLKWSQATSSLLPYTTRLETGGSAGLGKSLLLRGRLLLNSANPSLFQRYGLAPGGTHWQADPGLRNQQVSHLWASLRWTAAQQQLDSLTDVSRYAQVGAFVTRTDQLIGYTPAMAVQQASASENLQWAGLEASGRVKLARTLFAEGQVTAQQGFSGVNDSSWLHAYTRHLPNFWGKASVYYDNRDLSIAGILRTGLDVYYFSRHSPLAFDVMSGEFFPANYEIKGYVRVDASFAARISKTYVFLKVTHLNQGLGSPGYYSTPTWPMLVRTISFGVNWSFYD